MREHQNPTPSAIVQRYKFNSRNQQANEGVADFIAELRQIAKHCDYQDKLDDMLRDRLVSGVRNERIQRRLLAEPDLTFARAKEIAVGMETAEKNSHLLADPTKVASAATVNQLSNGNGPATKSQETKCSRCGGKHMASACKFKDATCYECNKKGHIARECRSKGKAIGGAKAGEEYPNPRPYKPQSTHVLAEEGGVPGDDTPGTYSMFAFGSQCPSPYKVNVSVNDNPLEMEIDTGASQSVTSERMYQDLWGEGQQPPLVKNSVILRTYTGEKVKPKGCAEVKVCYEGKQYQLPLLVVGGDGPALLGRNWLEAIKLNWQGIKRLTSENKRLDKILQTYAGLFEEGFGTLKGTAAKIHVDPSATPIFHKARPVPYVLREKIEQDLERLERSGTIEPVQYSE